jgi:hypothetical protein
MLNRTKRTLQKRCTEHALEARRLMGLGRRGEGLARYTGAVDMARRLAETDPDDPRPLGEYAAMLQSAGSLCAQAGQAAAALQSLSACEGIYRDLGDRWALDVRRQLAEVKARKTVTETGLSLGASAVLDADEAVTLYRGLLAEDDSAELALALAGALVGNAEALARYGDPDLAAASAGYAMRLCLPREQAPGFSAAQLQLAAGVREAAQSWAREAGGVTLAEALAAASQLLGRDRAPEDLAADLTRPAAGGVLMIPSDRCDPQLATGYAARLADVAIALLPAASWAGLRAGLEAHYLFAIGAPLQAPAPGQFAGWGIPWARLLFELCRVLAATPDPPWSFALALNLVPRHLWVIDRLLPLVQRAPEDTTGEPPGDGGGLGGLLRDCLAQDANLLTRNQDYAQAQQLRQLAATITG